MHQINSVALRSCQLVETILQLVMKISICGAEHFWACRPLP